MFAGGCAQGGRDCGGGFDALGKVARVLQGWIRKVPRDWGRHCRNPGLSIDPKKVRSIVHFWICRRPGKTAVECATRCHPQGFGEDTGRIRVRFVTALRWDVRGSSALVG